ncbi:MAG TPA: GNAT family N-acetyltransferase [Vicinamibacterales bacterium]
MTSQTFGAIHPVLRCGRCGKFADWGESRLQIVCGCRPHLDLLPVLVREAATPEDRERALSLFRRQFGHAPQVAFGQSVSLDDASALVAETEKEIGAALAWRPFEGAFHIMALATEPMWQRAGLGGYLVAEAELLARRRQHDRVVVTLTNDNIPALYFYQRRGYRVTAVVAGSVAAQTRTPASGFAGILVLDEVHLSKGLR